MRKQPKLWDLKQQTLRKITGAVSGLDDLKK